MAKNSNWDNGDGLANILFENKIVIEGGESADSKWDDASLGEMCDWLYQRAQSDKLKLRLCWPDTQERVSLHFAGSASYQAAFQLLASAWNLVMMTTLEKGVVYIALMQRKED